MFKQIDETEWDKLKTNVGNASHVPEALNGLLSDDERKVEKAYWKIDNYVVLQGDLSESASYLPRFLEEIVYVVKNKENILELLFQIGSGVSLNTQLEEECYKKVTDVLLRAKENDCIVGTKWAFLVKEYLKDLEELYNLRKEC